MVQLIFKILCNTHYGGSDFPLPYPSSLLAIKPSVISVSSPPLLPSHTKAT